MPVASSSSTDTRTCSGASPKPLCAMSTHSSTASASSARARTVTVCAVSQFCVVNVSARVSGVESLSTAICGLLLVAVTVMVVAGAEPSATV